MTKLFNVYIHYHSLSLCVYMSSISVYEEFIKQLKNSFVIFTFINKGCFRSNYTSFDAELHFKFFEVTRSILTCFVLE